ERHATRRLDELGRVEHGVVLDALGEQAFHGREVALDEQGGDGLLVGAECDELAIVAAHDRDADRARMRGRLSDLGEVRAGTSAVVPAAEEVPESQSISRTATR